MKSKLLSIAGLFLVIALLAGCGAAGSEAASTAAPSVETVQTETTEPETTLPETTAAPETEAPTEAAKPFSVEIIPVITTQQTQVRVTTADEFLAAIAPDTEIVLDAALIDLSTAAGYGKTNGEYYHWNEEYDGPGLYISGVSNLTIRGGGEDHNANVISSDPRYAYVLTFENCSNIHIAGFTAGHSKEPGYCAGGVLAFRNSQDILVEDCGLFGCGTIGVMGESTKNMQIVSNDIYECSVGGVEFSNCDDVNVDCNTFRDLGGPEFRVYGCGTITCNGEPVWDFSPRQ